MAYREKPERFEPGSIEACPGCHVTVVVPKTFICPSCQGDMRRAHDDGQRRITVLDLEPLPPICASCGADTQNYEKIVARRSYRDGVGPLGRFGLFLFSPILAVMAGDKQVATIEVAVPRCSNCQKGPKLSPAHVNFETGQLTLLVHYRLSDALALLREDA